MRNFFIGLIVGALVGAGAFYGWQVHQQRQLAAAILAETLAPEVPAKPYARPADWSVRTSKDKITDDVSWFMIDNSQESPVTLMVGCKGGALMVNFQSDSFYPTSSMGDLGDYYFTSYRFDDKPGVGGQDWPGMVHYTHPKDVSAFLDQAAQSKKLIIRISSTTMDSGNSSSAEQTFDLTGFGDGLTQLRSKCPALANTPAA